MPIIRMLAIAMIALVPLDAAYAATMPISITGTFDGTLDGRSFSASSLTFTGVSEEDAPEEVFDEYQYRLASLSVTVDGTEHRVTEAAMFFFAPLSRLAGIVDPDATKGLVRFDYGAGNRFHTDAQTQPFTTSGGSLLLSAGTNIALNGQTVAAVPEPESWALMMLGFGAVGLAQRRRSRPTSADTAIATAQVHRSTARSTA